MKLIDIAERMFPKKYFEPVRRFHNVNDLRAWHWNVTDKSRPPPDQFHLREQQAHEAIRFLLGELDAREDQRRNAPLDVPGLPNLPPMAEADKRLGTRQEFLGNEIETLLRDVSGEKTGFVLVTMPMDRPGPSWVVQNVRPEFAAMVLSRQVDNLKDLGHQLTVREALKRG